ncbi:hypothetical protein PR048_024524 [Dryococelus australis]|uniref:Uncharacterized protein n=1 Tax=Dryococelus australis TaxID=614101 RepID=A0ABQ9GNS6_9NEOP|nr:hypothetical protein PR048_024524 [Dryococelus australis]
MCMDKLRTDNEILRRFKIACTSLKHLPCRVFLGAIWLCLSEKLFCYLTVSYSNAEELTHPSPNLKSFSNTHKPYTRKTREKSPLFFSRGAAVAERLVCSPPVMANRAQTPVGSLPDFRTWESCRTMPPVGGFSRGSPVSLRPFIPVPLHTRLNHPRRLSDPSLLRASQITSSLTHSLAPFWRAVPCFCSGIHGEPLKAIGHASAYAKILINSSHDYGIRKVCPGKSAIGSKACRAGLINCDPIVKATSPTKQEVKPIMKTALMIVTMKNSVDEVSEDCLDVPTHFTNEFPSKSGAENAESFNSARYIFPEDSNEIVDRLRRCMVACLLPLAVNLRGTPHGRLQSVVRLDVEQPIYRGRNAQVIDAVQLAVADENTISCHPMGVIEESVEQRRNERAGEMRHLICTVRRHGGNTARLARRSDETLDVRISVARIAPSLLDLGRGVPTGVHPTLKGYQKCSPYREQPAAAGSSCPPVNTLETPRRDRWSSVNVGGAENMPRYRTNGTWRPINGRLCELPSRREEREQPAGCNPTHYPLIAAPTQVPDKDSNFDKHSRRPAVPIFTYPTEATVAERLARSLPTKANRVQYPAGSPDFRKWESCRTMPLVGGSSWGYPVSPTRSFRRRSVFASIALIVFQDLAVKSRPDLFALHLTYA